MLVDANDVIDAIAKIVKHGQANGFDLNSFKAGIDDGKLAFVTRTAPADDKNGRYAHIGIIPRGDEVVDLSKAA